MAELVARLEGIPLALELAAARVRAMSVADINKRLNDRYKILTGGSRVLQQRQQTLRALVDWSYELLNENEQLLLRRLAVFVGGFDLEAAEKVCGVEPIEDFEVLDLLGSLVDKSLVMLEERDDGSRYRMLETIRDYAAEKLKADADEATAAARAPLRVLLPARQGCERDGIDGAEQAQLADAPGDRAGQSARGDVAGPDRGRGPGDCSEAGGGTAGLLDPARLHHRRAPARQGRAADAGRAGLQPGQGACAVRRRGIGGLPERPCRGAPDARRQPW